MKTAISLPDELFDAADHLAAELGLSRSGLYAKAVSAFVERHRGEEVTARLNEVYSRADEADSLLDPLLEQLQAVALWNEDW